MSEKVSRSNLIKFIKLVFRYKKQHFFAFLFMVSNAIFLLALPYLMMKIIDDAIKGNNIELLIKLSVLYLIAVIVQNGSQLISDYFYSIIGKRIICDLRLKLVNHLQKLSGRYYSNIKAGELTAIINNDVTAIEELATKMIFSTISDILISIPMLIFLFKLQYDLLILSIALQPLMMYLQNKFTNKITQKTLNLRNSFGEFSAITQELVSGLINFVTLGARKYFFNKYIPNAKENIKAGIGLELTFSLNMIILSFIGSLTTIGILGYGGYKVIVGTMTIGGLVAFIQYSQWLFAPVMRVARLSVKVKQALVSVDKIFRVLDEPIDIKHINRGDMPKCVNGKIEFKDVSFSYDKNIPLIENISIVFEKNKITALVGESGSGKTTISNLIFRLWDVNKGEILLDGINIKEFNLKYLRKIISIVSQDVFLFNDTILNNLVLSNKKISMEQVKEAVKNADIYDFIMSLPDQFNTIVGDRGVKLSGGQKQRISIARAILKNSPIIILDEATSSLDNNSERHIKEYLNCFLKNKTVIIIAHRLSTVESADVIYTMKDGKIVEQGTHDKLMKLKNTYYNLYIRSQNAPVVESISEIDEERLVCGECGGKMRVLGKEHFREELEGGETPGDYVVKKVAPPFVTVALTESE